jgi:hypothetical protein
MTKRAQKFLSRCALVVVTPTHLTFGSHEAWCLVGVLALLIALQGAVGAVVVRRCARKHQ